jgi:hypothetical protein
MHYFSPQEIKFLEKTLPGRSRAETAKLFNRRFGLRLRHSQIRAACANRGIASGLDCRFPAGGEPWNKGLKGFSPPGSEKGRFKKKNKPWNYRPVGTERVTKDGYVEVKVADPRTWKPKHRIVWERANGPVPRGHAVIFADRDRLNVTLKNLLLVSRKELAIMNRLGLIYDRPEFTRTGKLIADVRIAVAGRKRGARRRKRRTWHREAAGEP